MLSPAAPSIAGGTRSSRRRRCGRIGKPEWFVTRTCYRTPETSSTPPVEVGHWVGARQAAAQDCSEASKEIPEFLVIQARRICSVHRVVVHVDVDVGLPSPKSNRILTHPPPHHRIVIPRTKGNVGRDFGATQRISQSPSRV